MAKYIRCFLSVLGSIFSTRVLVDALFFFCPVFVNLAGCTTRFLSSLRDFSDRFGLGLFLYTEVCSHSSEQKQKRKVQELRCCVQSVNSKCFKFPLAIITNNHEVAAVLHGEVEGGHHTSRMMVHSGPVVPPVEEVRSNHHSHELGRTVEVHESA